MDNREASIFKAIEQLRTLSHLYMKKRRVLAQSVALTEAQWRMLEEIATDGFMPSLFASQRDLSKAAVSKLLKQLIELKLVIASSSENDGRYRNYALTETAEEKLNQLKVLREEAINNIWKRTDPELLESSIKFNEQLIDLFISDQK